MSESLGAMLKPWRLFEALGSEGKALALLLLAFACITAPHFQHIPPWASALAVAAFCLKLWLIKRGASAPNKWLLSAFAALAGAAVLLEYKTILGRDAGVTLLVILSCIKLLELRARRDVFVLLFLAFFLALCQFFFSQEIGTALLVFGGITLLFIALVAQQISTDGAEAPVSLALMVKLVLRMYMFALPMAIAAFVLFPRFGPLWGSADGTYGTTGMSDTMTPGSISRLIESNAIAFRVKFEDQIPPPALRYWRVMVLGQYDGRTWRERVKSAETISLPDNNQVVSYTITLESHAQTWLPILDLPATMPQLVSATENQQIRMAQGSFYLDRLLRERIQIQGQSHLSALLSLQETRLSLQPWLELPAPFNPRTLNFALELRQRYPNDSDAQLAQRILQIFRDQPFRYTLTPPPLGPHSADDFLFNTRAGFCEYYSSAFVILMRALDIPARVVVGYQGGELNRIDNYLEVRQRDAHAWSEIWLQGRGWVRVDPTAAVAPERVERGANVTLPPTTGLAAGLGQLMGIAPGQPMFNIWRELRQYRDAVNNAWNQWVISYHREGQADLFKRMGFEEPNWRDMLLSLLALVASISLSMAWFLFRRRERPDPFLLLYSSFEHKLSQFGLVREDHEGPEQFQRRALKVLNDPDRQRAKNIFNAWIAARYQARPQITYSQLKKWISDFRISS
jgi:transglutaminase-like putative cysteine protease